MTVDHEDDIDPPKGQKLFFTNNWESGNRKDHRRRQIYPPNPVEITLVPCHSDMLIMFASPQGQLVSFLTFLFLHLMTV